MTEEILANLYRIQIPLPQSPLKAVNSYVIKDPERNLIIDTGWNQEICMNAMQTGLKELGVDLNKTDFFITHLHADHLGLVLSLVTKTSKIYFNQPDADRLKGGFLWDDFVSFARLNGYPDNEIEEVSRSHPGLKFRTKETPVFHTLKEGDLIRIGNYAFRCIATPGHSFGHLCLYEPDKKILVAGDHVLNDITPNIQLWADDWNPLREYLASLEKVYQLDIELVLPGHRSIFRDYRKRIDELRQHHEKRFNEIISILGKKEQNAFQVASQMSWDIVYDSWDLFPVSQKWFATGEALAHLKYLDEKGIIRKGMRGKKRVFSLNSTHPE